jgi:hypothetical protein
MVDFNACSDDVLEDHALPPIRALLGLFYLFLGLAVVCCDVGEYACSEVIVWQSVYERRRRVVVIRLRMSGCESQDQRPSPCFLAAYPAIAVELVFLRSSSKLSWAWLRLKSMSTSQIYDGPVLARPCSMLDQNVPGSCLAKARVCMF